MDVVLSVGGDVEVEHHVDVGDVESSGRHVGGHQDVALARLELVQRAQALRLRKLAVQTYGLEAQVSQQQCDAQGVVAGGHEDDRGLALELVQQVRQVAVFVLGRDEQILLHQRLLCK